MKSVTAVLIALLCISGCASQKGGSGPGGYRPKSISGHTPVTVGDGSIYLHGDGLGSGTGWKGSSGSAWQSNDTDMNIARAGLMTGGLATVTALCPTASAQTCEAIEVDFDNNEGQSDSQSGTVTFSNSSFGNLVIQGSGNAADIANRVHWRPFGDDQIGLDDPHVDINQPRPPYFKIKGLKVNTHAIPSGAGGIDYTKPLRVRIEFQ